MTARTADVLVAEAAETVAAIDRRDSLIVEVYESGHSLRQLARVFRLDPATVHGVLRKAEKAEGRCILRAQGTRTTA